jgi:hypothetical protein
LDHRKITTTQGYYRVDEHRHRSAIDKVTALQFDRHGRRIWRQAAELMATEHTRRAIGSVAVPFGTRAEPSNVKAGGQSCPSPSAAPAATTSLRPLPHRTTSAANNIRRRDRPGGLLHEHQQVA